MPVMLFATVASQSVWSVVWYVNGTFCFELVTAMFSPAGRWANANIGEGCEQQKENREEGGGFSGGVGA